MIASFRGRYGWLSNFYPVNIERDGIVYPTAEHAYVAAKVTPESTKRWIATIDTPGHVKRVGRTLLIRSEWDSVKLEEMLCILRLKFEHPELATLLRRTAGQVIVEGNAWGDTYWGVCNGVGENHLGNLIMRVRGELS